MRLDKLLNEGADPRLLKLQQDLKLKESLEPLDRRIMLYFQTRALEYETGPNFEVDTELVNNGPYPRLEIRFPDHYEYDIYVTFITGNNLKPRIQAVINNRCEGKRMTYVMLQTADSVNVFVVNGRLTSGADDIDCPSWEAAIDFFMREVDTQIKDMFAAPGSGG